ncbi:Crp/Fnr family transcriptional regulator [Streptosporangium lutulentum]|uniref:CRP-like cAMP-binding protein n=1 Tax=Streptosporangium lutulentum TaxID=1461250 RepID=A0ABT9Q3F3_9ACTN|nr:cyclic nucleotide-binding domain-containing protein [Streptosporangium lutulentum]MDP9840980.1 CRP-like cAMP-binding protein [Streptosporangium lutulentum]
MMATTGGLDAKVGDGVHGEQGCEPGLSAEQFRRLAAYGDREEVQAGQVLYGTGDRSYDLFLVESAAIDVVCDATATEPERVVYSRCAGDFTGELSILTGQTVFLTARVRESGLVVHIRADRLREVLGEEVDIADVLVDAFAIRRRMLLESASSVLEIIGVSDCAENRALRTFAARLQIPHTAVDADSIAGQTIMASYGIDDSRPPGGRRLRTGAAPRHAARPRRGRRLHL